MDEISKKELLEQTGISYGQLYRWKREGLLPEEWFVKRSAFTGQETYFPRDRMLGRVRAILAMKDSCSLDEIRERLAATVTTHNVRAALLAVCDMSPAFVDGLATPVHTPELGIDALGAAVGLYEAAAQVGGSEQELQSLTDEALRAAASCLPAPAQVALIDAQGSKHLVVTAAAGQIATDAKLKLLATVQVADIVERIRTKMPEALFEVSPLPKVSHS
ncbi:MAG: YhbD family protein [Coriobacteriales bacterium]|jgi:DNA-binding transcriptional MerR regulator|nr:YhbD family protein [Coriobacteriales bacterium]